MGAIRRCHARAVNIVIRKSGDWAKYIAFARFILVLQSGKAGYPLRITRIIMLAGILMQNPEQNELRAKSRALGVKPGKRKLRSLIRTGPTSPYAEEGKTALAFEERSTSKAADRSVRPTRAKVAGHRQQVPVDFAQGRLSTALPRICKPAQIPNSSLAVVRRPPVSVPAPMER
jgi:hypothetical protein